MNLNTKKHEMKELKRNKMTLNILCIGIIIIFYGCSSSSSQEGNIDDLSMGIINPDNYVAFIEKSSNYDTLSFFAVLKMDEQALYNVLQIISGFKQVKRLKIHSSSLDKAGGIANWDSEIRFLSFQNCNLIEVPEFVRTFTSLEELDLSDNQLSEQSLRIENLNGLQRLNLSDNQLEEIPSSVFRMANLRTLNVEHNNLSGIPDSIKLLRNLRYLSVYESGLSQSEIDTLEVLLPNTTVINELIVE